VRDVDVHDASAWLPRLRHMSRPGRDGWPYPATRLGGIVNSHRLQGASEVEGRSARRTGSRRGTAVLSSGSTVAVIGGGPAGSLFAHALLAIAARVDLDLEVDIYEPRRFDQPGPIGCNMCGGLMSETLVQNLAADGIFLDTSVVQRGIDSYVLHTDVGSVRIGAPRGEVRIGTVHRGSGPRGAGPSRWGSLDQHLLTSAVRRGAKLIPVRVDDVTRTDGRPTIHARGRTPAT
jgi:hypothetical protein